MREMDNQVNVYTNKFEASTGKTVERFRIEDYPAILTRDGFKNAQGAEVLKILRIERVESAKGK